MADILHQLRVHAPADRVFRALTMRDELAVWWTPDVVAVPVEGSVAEFGFDARRTVIRMRIETLRPAALVSWFCLDGIEEWRGTQIRFSLQPDKGHTVLNFCHAGWRSAGGVFGLCSFDWARYLMKLRDLAEGLQTGEQQTARREAHRSEAAANKALVRRLYATLMSAGDTLGADQLLDEDYVDHDIPGMNVPGGRADLKSAVCAVRTSFPDIQPELFEMAAEGAWVAVRVEAFGTHSGAPFLGIDATGRKMRWREIHLFRCASGKIVEHRGVFDLVSIMQQLGVRELPG
ncbi:MAG: ester cyclase [Burkholderiales bacterium]|nr:ester cyclase [Burkholderiales bacterium]